MSVVDENGFMIDGPKRPAATLLLAHGAGAPMDSDFMQVFAEGVAATKIRVVRFEFPYMFQRRTGGKKRPPDRQAVLEQTWIDLIDEFRGKNLFIGGKSMGGRIASMVADRAKVDGVICLGYPFHPPGKPDRLRTEHLAELSTRALIVQGERDTFGNRSEVSTYKLSKNIKVEFLKDGDHSFKPRKASGLTLESNLAEAIELAREFLLS